MRPLGLPLTWAPEGTWRRLARTRAPQIRARTDPELRVLHALERPGCPICHESGGADRHYFFWFFAESYYESFTLDALTRSLGFCLGHGDVLARMTVGASQLTFVHEVLVQRARAALRDPPAADRRQPQGPPLAASARCPACQNRLNGADRNAFWLGALLEDPALVGGRYGHPSLLCFPHLRAITPRISDAVLVRLLQAHESAISAALEALSAPDRTRGLEAGRREDLLAGLLPVLSLAVSHDTDIDPYAGLQDGGRPQGTRDPVQEFVESLAGDACPICREIRRAWLEWTGWLDAAAGRGEPHLGDLLPTCAEHVWPLVRRGAPPLALTVARHALSAALTEVAIAGRALVPRLRPERERLTERIRRVFWEPRERIRAARSVLARGLRCPVCERLATARDGAIALLFAVLEDRRARAALEHGYGLCLGHFARVLAADPPREIRALLVEVEDARLASLGWELREATRKAAWQFRPEEKGAEQTAWRRALLRFSGSLREHAA